MHRFSDAWILWAHLPQNADWSLTGYQQIMKFDTIEQACALMDCLPEKLIMGCMLFLMKEGITPLWEDEQNKHGGCFSYKVIKNISSVWRDVSYSMVGNTLTGDVSFNKTITGISLSPKKNFCILKVWMGTRKFRDPSKIKLLKPEGCIFKEN